MCLLLRPHKVPKQICHRKPLFPKDLVLDLAVNVLFKIHQIITNAQSMLKEVILEELNKVLLRLYLYSRISFKSFDVIPFLSLVNVRK